jgi:penicillin-binding protein 1A
VKDFLKNISAKVLEKIKSFRKKDKPKLPLKKRILRYVIYFFVFLFLYFGCVDLNILWLFGRSPKMRELKNPKLNVASELYSADGKLIGKFFNENRTPVKYKQISPILIKALIATEDNRFYEHSGIDFKALLSVFWSIMKGDARGGSTITQQLVKNLFKTRANYSRGLFGYIPFVKTIIYKTKEWITAVKIEANFKKEEILTMYFNTVDFGSNAYGIKTAAKTFFNTTPDNLNAEQSALLVGILKAPTFYSPIMNPENALKRRNIVLRQMLKYAIINQKEHDKYVTLPILLDYKVENNYDGNASYFREAVYNSLKEWLKENNYDLYADGLKIYSTIDSKLQQYAEAAVAEHMKKLQKKFNQHWEDKNPWIDGRGNEISGFIENVARETSTYKYLSIKYKNNKDSVNYYMNKPHRMRVFTWKGERDTTLSPMDSIRYYKKFLHAGFFTIDPFTSFIKTWVGDINFKYFKYDHVKQSKRQPGSTFKAFVYAAALENGFGPCDKMIDKPVIVNYVEKGQKKTWTPHNADGVFTGEEVTLKYAFAKSINCIAVQVMQEIGWKKVIEYAHKLGIKTPLADVPSVCLGSCDVSLYELVNAFCPFINEGYYIEPVLVTKITDKNGKVLYEYKENKKRVLTEETAFLMQEMLRGGLHEPGGTTQALFEYDLFKDWRNDFGGKTGTSTNYSDGWFIGVTKNLISGSWVGGEQRCIHFRNPENGEGCHTALPIYGIFMEKVFKDNKFDYVKGQFPKPKIKISKSYTCHTRIEKLDSIGAAKDTIKTSGDLGE